MTQLIVFIFLFLFLTNWFQIVSFASIPFRKGKKVSNFEDKWVYDVVHKKTGLKLLNVTTIHDKKM